MIFENKIILRRDENMRLLVGCQLFVSDTYHTFGKGDRNDI